jgi:bacillolysin
MAQSHFNVVFLSASIALFSSQSATALTPFLQADSPLQLPFAIENALQTSAFHQITREVQNDPELKKLLNETSSNEISVSSVAADETVSTVKFQHYFKGLEVMGSMAFHHTSNQNTEVRSLVRRFNLETTPTLSESDARALARAHYGEVANQGQISLKILPDTDSDSARLIYWVDLPNRGLIPGSDFVVDAHSGEIVAKLSKMETAVPIEIRSAKDQGLQIIPELIEKDGAADLGSCIVVDLGKPLDTKKVSAETCKKILRGEVPQLTDDTCQVVFMDSPNSGDPLGVEPSKCKVASTGRANRAMDASEKNALTNSRLVSKYYQNVHGRNSFDNEGSKLVSLVHVGINFANAAWVQGLNFMMYGDGDGEELGDMTNSVDVAGHEMTHGVISKTAKLGRMYESGALNEAYADFFGKMIANDGNWVMGKTLAAKPGGFQGIRDLAKPGNLKGRVLDENGKPVLKGYPAHVKEQIKKTRGTECGEENDSCWVHWNSTIPGHASYLVTQAIGKKKAEKLYYLTMTQYLGSEATFKSAAHSTLSACKTQLDADTCAKVKKAFTQVGML